MDLQFHILVLLISYILQSNAVLRPSENPGGSLEIFHQCPQGCSCMGESVTCSAWNPETIPLPIPPTTTILTLPKFQYTHINESFFYKTPDLQWLQITHGLLQEFPSLPKLFRLSYLDLSFNVITQLRARSFTKTPYVTQLNLSRNQIQTVDKNFFEGLTNLRILDLSHNPIMNLPTATVFQHVRTLNHLDLSSTNLDDDTQMQWVNTLNFLYFLDLSHNNILSLSHISNSVLSTLDISFNPLVSMPSLSKVPSLSELFASHTLLSDLSSADFSYCEHLIILDLSYSKIQVISSGIFRHCHQLRTLRLNNNMLVHIETDGFKGLDNLSELRMENSHNLHELNSNIFKDTPNLNTFHLDNSGLNVLPRSLSLLNNLTTFTMQNTTLLCNCHANWIPTWLEFTNHSQWKGIKPVTCENQVAMGVQDLHTHIRQQACEQIEIAVPPNWITLKAWDDTAILNCNATGNPTPNIIWLTPNKHLFVHNKTQHSSWVNYKISDALARAHEGVGSKFEVLESGQILIRNMSREDIGRYRCFAYNDVSNASIEMFLGIQDDPFRALIIQTYIFGLSCAAVFLLTTLIVQFIRALMDRFGWECCCCKNRISSRANQIKQLLESVEFYKSAQLEKLRENYTSQVTNIKDSCYSQMEKVRDSYAHQSKNLKDLCDYSTLQFTGAKDQYLDQVNKIRDYSTGQMSRVRENYVFQRQRIRKFSAHQLLKLRETYKYQQKTLNKLLETLPDLYIQNCRTGACQRTDSIIFDELDGLDAYYKIDFLDNQSIVSDYYTPSSTLTRPSKNKHHSRNQSSASGTTEYQDTITRQNFSLDKDTNEHLRYHNRSYSLVPPGLHKVDSVPGHKRSISATQTPGSLLYSKSPFNEESVHVKSETPKLQTKPEDATTLHIPRVKTQDALPPEKDLPTDTIVNIYEPDNCDTASNGVNDMSGEIQKPSFETSF